MNGIDVHVSGIVNQVVQLSASNLGDFLGCTL